MKRLIILAPLALAGCAELQAFVPGLLPTPAELCAMSPATLEILARELKTDAATLSAACEIVN